MDHNRYAWSNLFERKPLVWPHQAKVALMITIPVEFFPLNPTGKPFKAPGSMVTAYPDFRHYTTRDYGNRVGIFRLLKVLDEFNLKANFAVNSEVAARYPNLIEEILKNGHEIIAHGVDMDELHYGGMDNAHEAYLVEKSMDTLRKISGQKIQGWMSPAYSESFETPDLVKKYGCTFLCDWSNDDMPYIMDTAHGSIVAMPVSQEISDRQIIINYHQTEDSFEQQVCDQLDTLADEAHQYGGRLLSLTLTPYISGLPFRISTIRNILQYTKQKSVINLTGSEITEIFSSQI
ncbi:MAG: polysaccharide deacetylase family protein [Saprospiraceae bacterium]|nr:polysaccharide deacetylase family protein [Saprospiraceae bacterium]